ncbi:MAG: hypothetical protein HZC51_03650 [Nitrospirae bacterium]|nr:hypothetical protein [Nitrospirota bacterium]
MLDAFSRAAFSGGRAAYEVHGKIKGRTASRKTNVERVMRPFIMLKLRKCLKIPFILIVNASQVNLKNADLPDLVRISELSLDRPSGDWYHARVDPVSLVQGMRQAVGKPPAFRPPDQAYLYD